MLSVFAAAILSTIPIDGQVDKTGGDYAVVEFEVPAGAVEITVHHEVASEANILDFGVWDPDGFRGWGGGLTDDAVIGVDESSRGYLPGPLPAGTWQVVIGKAKVVDVPAAYHIDVTISDTATLTPRPRADYPGVALESGARWYAGDLHVHSRESGDASATFDQINSLAHERNLDFVVLSDHNTVAQHPLIAAYQGGVDDLLFVRGAEVTTYSGHGNALGATEYIDHRLGLDGRSGADVIADVVAAGGSFIVNHPRLELGSACIGCAWNIDPTPWDQVTAMEILTGPLQNDSLIGKPARQMWDDLLDQGFRITAVGGSDDHRAGVGEDPLTDSRIGSPTTLVYADELSEAAIIEAIRAGRVQVLLSGPDDPRVDLEVDSDSGQVGRIGDSISGDKLTIRARVTGGAGSHAVLVTDGREGESRALDSDDSEVSWEVAVPEEGARYRIHVYSDLGLVTVTNHVFVDFVQGPGGGGCGCRAPGGGGSGGGLLLVVMAAALAWRRRARRARGGPGPRKARRRRPA